MNKQILCAVCGGNVNGDNNDSFSLMRVNKKKEGAYSDWQMFAFCVKHEEEYNDWFKKTFDWAHSVSKE